VCVCARCVHVCTYVCICVHVYVYMCVCHICMYAAAVNIITACEACAAGAGAIFILPLGACVFLWVVALHRAHLVR